jgi:hypothetical protein
MNENLPIENLAAEEISEPIIKMKKKRDIFRFNGQEEMSINLEHIYKITRSGKRITFQANTADFVEFEDEESSRRAYEQIISVWSSDVLE